MKKIKNAILFPMACGTQVDVSVMLKFETTKDLHSLTKLKRMNPILEEIQNRINMLDRAYFMIKTLDEKENVITRISLFFPESVSNEDDYSDEYVENPFRYDKGYQRYLSGNNIYAEEESYCESDEDVENYMFSDGADFAGAFAQ